MVTAHQAAKLQRALPETIEYTGEFGPEIVLFIPFMRFCNSIGALYGKRIISYSGMECFYEAAGLRLFDTKISPRKGVPFASELPWLPLVSEHHYNHLAKSIAFDHPNYREHFGSKGILHGWPLEPDEPIALVYNKIANEWGEGPINYYSPEDLESIFDTLPERYRIVYVQHDLQRTNSSDFSRDHNDLNIPPRHSGRMNEIRQNINAYLLKRPDVIRFQSIVESVQKADASNCYNLVHCSLISHSKLFVTIQGGGSHLLAGFGDSDMYILHRRGREYPEIYRSGYYSFMANEPPRLFVADNSQDIVRKLRELE